MSAVQHYVSMIGLCFLVGVIGDRVQAPIVVLLIAGMLIGFFWHKVTGYCPTKKDGE